MNSLEPADVPPLPPDEAPRDVDGCRLWIGNLDQRVTEFALLKILQKFGPLDKFDFLYHKTGLDQGKPRGYCFVSYKSRETADRARQTLDGKLALTKKMAVKWAHVDKQVDETADSKTATSTSTPSAESQIRAIEAKLQFMEDTSKDFTMSFKPAAPPGTNKLSALHKDANKPQHQHKPYRKHNAKR